MIRHQYINFFFEIWFCSFQMKDGQVKLVGLLSGLLCVDKVSSFNIIQCWGQDNSVALTLWTPSIHSTLDNKLTIFPRRVWVRIIDVLKSNMTLLQMLEYNGCAPMLGVCLFAVLRVKSSLHWAFLFKMGWGIDWLPITFADHGWWF